MTIFRFTIRAALLDGSIYEELRERRETTFHALVSVPDWGGRVRDSGLGRRVIRQRRD